LSIRTKREKRRTQSRRWWDKIGSKQPICQNDAAGFVGMNGADPHKTLKTLERAKGIEPSYSAWKGFGG
jgi:hypothetical protein